MMKYCDLHTHSYFSDGTDSPTEIIRKAESIGLSAVALTDHTTTAGLDEFVEAARGTSVKAIRGVELSTDYGDTELHIIALYLGREHYETINELVREMHVRKDEANRILVDALVTAGFRISYDEIAGDARGHFNRAHVAAALHKAGYAASIPEAFDKYLRPEVGYYPSFKRIDALDTIALIRSLGAVPVIAHPYLSLKNKERISRFLTEAVPRGLYAMETMYPAYTDVQTAEAKALAHSFGILESGGSDYHADKRPHVALGMLNIPDNTETALSTLTSEHRQRVQTQKEI